MAMNDSLPYQYSVLGSPTEYLPEDTAHSTVATTSTFERDLRQGQLTPDENPHALDPKNHGDKRIALATATVESETEGLVVDLARVAGHMGLKFAIAPTRYCGRRIYRSRDTSDGEAYFYVGAAHRTFASWAMHFEPGVVEGYQSGSGSRSTWRTSSCLIPPIPAEHRPENDKGKFILWEQEWAEKILQPKDPALLEHIVGDVYVVRAVWDLTPLEAAALRNR